MSEQAGTAISDESSGDHQDSPLTRAAAAGPLPGADPRNDSAAANTEPAAAHDSPAGVEEGHAADPDADGDGLAGPDRLTSIYGPPPGDQQGSAG